MKIYLMAMIKNIVALICFTILAIVFNKWWIIFFAILFWSFIESKGDDNND